MKCLSVAIQMKTTEQYIPVVLFIIIFMYGTSNFWVCANEIPKWPDSNKRSCKSY